MKASELWQYFRDKGVSLDDISSKTGYSFGYLLNLFQGRTPFSARTRYKFMAAFPETIKMLLPELPKEPA